MKIKTLLLGSAAAVAVVGGAQAADLSVAEPVEYVKVCDYFGTGYWYIPGTDTCIKIGGHVQLTSEFHSDASIGSHSTSWNFNTEEEVNFDLKSETEYGPLEAYASVKATATAGFENGFITDGYFVSLGGFKAGAYQNAAYSGAGLGPYSFMDSFGLAYDIVPFIYSDVPTVQLSWASGGFGASVAVSDPTAIYNSYYGGYGLSDSTPLITGNITTTQKNFSAGLAGGFVDTYGGSEWGITGQVLFNIGSADKLQIQGSYGSNFFTGLDNYGPGESYGDNDGYVVQGSWQHNFSKTLRLDVDAAYGKDARYAATLAQVGADIVWMPVAGFSAKAALGYSKWSIASSGTWAAELGVRRDW